MRNFYSFININEFIPQRGRLKYSKARKKKKKHTLGASAELVEVKLLRRHYFLRKKETGALYFSTINYHTHNTTLLIVRRKRFFKSRKYFTHN